jgi:hypothetical protein
MVSSDAHELVLHPPTVRLSVPRKTNDGKGWEACATFDTASGPIHITACVYLPEAIDLLAMLHKQHQILDMAAKFLGGPGGAPVSAGGFGDVYEAGFSFPNPFKAIKKEAAKVVKAAKAAANTALSVLPAPLKTIALAPLQMVQKATDAIGLHSAVQHAVNILGSAHIPGTNLPIMALSPIGAAVHYGAQVIGPEAISDILNSPSMAEAITAGAVAPPIRRAIPTAAKSLAQARVQQSAAILTDNAAFAREVGIPTLKVNHDYQDGARAMIKMLRGAYVGDLKSKQQMLTLRNKAAAGDPTARMLWTLAAQISEEAWKGRREVRPAAVHGVGDGFGEGYGVAGYRAPQNPAVGADFNTHLLGPFYAPLL